ncbi:hypothetical protein [Aliiroseovarius sp. F20344]|uniref:hypothetical protein n=1 Tax=Aliiroseovarius sp. F20344 TaxID=2926414 RepID=UPI001FF6457F|nr:hypothetical protein [Aliiroseovarius sp. F20344]MCK0143462.1 hypothetical protein [Aliiroseovarius sp. F20344]
MTAPASQLFSDSCIEKPDRILAKCHQLVAWPQKLTRCFATTDEAAQATNELGPSEFLITVQDAGDTKLSFYHRHFDDPNVPVLDEELEGWCQILEIEGELDQAKSMRSAALLVAHDGNINPLLASVPADYEQCAILASSGLTLFARNNAGNFERALQFAGSLFSTDDSRLAAYLGTLHGDLGGHANRVTDELPPQGKFMTLWHSNAKRDARLAAKAAIETQRPQIHRDFPEASTDRQTVNGRKEFQIDAGHGKVQRCYLSPEGYVRPITNRSILLIHTGQSNAGVHPAGGPIPGIIKTRHHILTPNDGNGSRGLMGAVPDEDITDLVPLDEFARLPLQSVVGVAASSYLSQIPDGQDWPQFIVRSEAIGGQAFIGNTQTSRRPGLHKNELNEPAQCFKNLVSTTAKLVEIAAQQGAPTDVIYIALTHQESDRATTRRDYADMANAFFADLEDGVAHLETPVVWLLDQSPGTYRDSNWQVRLALQDLADEFENVHLVQPRHPYPLFDQTHWSNRAKALYGEYLGRAIWKLEQGQPFCSPKLVSAKLTGREIVIRFDNTSPLTLDSDHFPAPPDNYGFQIIGPRHPLAIQQVQVTSDTEVTITLTHDPGDYMQGAIAVRYAMKDLPKEDRVDGWAAGLGCLREEEGFASHCFEGVTHYTWIPAFEVTGL